jgi:HD-GYP domain-containing protein (c-di-GMP phosphodiesterase class II)/ActR/RegA family two-component response regulator
MAQRILIAQPERKHQLKLAELFEERGDVVITATSLKEVGNIVQRYKPEYILLDIQMLGDNWASAVPNMEQGAPESRFILTTNGGSKRNDKQLKKWGVVRPPFTTAKIDRALEMRRNGAGTAPQVKKKRRGLQRIRFPIRYKITFPYIALALALAMAGAYIVTNVVLDTIEERFTNQLIETGRLTAEWMVKEEDRLLESLRLVAHTQGVPEAALAGDAETLREIALPIAINGQVEAIEILDRNGVSILSLRQQADGDFEDYYASRGETVFQQWIFVQRVLDGQVDELGDKYAGVEIADWGIFFYVSGPIVDQDGQLLGVVLIGKSLSTIATEIRAATLAQATLYNFQGEPLATAFLEQVGSLDPVLVQSVVNRQAEESFTRELSVTNIDYSEIIGTLEARGGSDVAVIGTSLPQTFLVQPSQVTRLQIFGLATGAFIFVISAGLLIANRITRPLLQVVKASAEVAQGNLTVKLPTAGNDELSTLATAFNDMVGALERSNRELMDAYNSTLEGWSKALELRDEETEGHTQRVTDLTVRLARRLGFSDEDLIQIQRGALLHDIGKMGIPDEILNKPGPLNEAEWDLMRKHPIYAYQMLSPITYLRPALAIPCCHHERWDGSGYPLGWKAQDIPMPARIFAVVDVWDALSSDRPYRAAWTEERVLEHLDSHKGVLFDSDVVDEFIRMIKTEGADGARKMPSPAIHQTLLRRTVPFG